jgi:hypothetical protein
LWANHISKSAPLYFLWQLQYRFWLTCGLWGKPENHFNILDLFYPSQVRKDFWQCDVSMLQMYRTFMTECDIWSNGATWQYLSERGPRVSCYQHCWLDSWHHNEMKLKWLIIQPLFWYQWAPYGWITLPFLSRSVKRSMLYPRPGVNKLSHMKSEARVSSLRYCSFYFNSRRCYQFLPRSRKTNKLAQSVTLVTCIRKVGRLIPPTKHWLFYLRFSTTSGRFQDSSILKWATAASSPVPSKLSITSINHLLDKVQHSFFCLSLCLYDSCRT